MAAIDRFVFREKKVTMAELLKALEADWEGYDDLRHMMLSAPKYGNGDDDVGRLG